MAITATFKADFTSFQAAVQAAEVKLKSFETGAAKVESSLTRMSNSLSGTKLIQDATLMAAAVDKVGGISKLTENELARLSAQAKEAAAKMQLMGIGVPANLQAIANAAKPVEAGLGSMIGTVGKLAGAFGIGFGLSSLVSFGKGMLETAGQIKDLSVATGVSKQALQELAYVGAGVSVGMDEIGRAVGGLSRRLAGGDEGAAASVNYLGLNLQKLIAAGPKEAFIQLGEAVGRIPDPMKRSEIAADLFGSKLSQDLIPLLGNLREEMEKVPKTAIISDAQIEAAEKLGDAWDRAAIRVKASIFGMLDAVQKFSAVPPINLEESVNRLVAAGIRAGPLFDELAKHRAKEAKETELAMQAAYDYAAAIGTVAGAAQGSTVVEKIHADMLAYTEAKSKKTAEATKRYEEEVARVTQSVRLLERDLPGLTDSIDREGKAELEAIKIHLKNVAALDELNTRIRFVEDGSDKMTSSWTSFGQVIQDVGIKIPVASSGLEDLSQAFANLAQISGGSFGGVVQGIGKIIAGVDLAQTAVKNMAPTIDANNVKVVASFSEMAASVMSLVGVFYTVGRAVQGFFDQFLPGLGVIDRQLDQFKVYTNQLNTMTKKNNEVADSIASSGFKTKEQLAEAASLASRVYDTMVASGNYTTASLTQAYKTYQQALADAGSAAAQLWLDAQNGVTAGSAKVVSALDALRSQRDSLSQSIAGEAPEEVMGVIESQIRGQIAVLDRNIEEQSRSLERQAEEAARSLESALENIDVDAIVIPIVWDIPPLPGQTFEAPEGVATGGMVTAAGVQQFGGGGVVLPFPRRGTDTVPAMLTPGEMVLTRGQQNALAKMVGSGSGGGTSIVIEQGAIQILYPLMNDPRAKAEIATLIGDALISRIRNTGTRLPSVA